MKSMVSMKLGFVVIEDGKKEEEMGSKREGRG